MEIIYSARFNTATQEESNNNSIVTSFLIGRPYVDCKFNFFVALKICLEKIDSLNHPGIEP